MKENKLFALTALFDNPDAIMNAAEKVSDRANSLFSFI
jgi:hypothetical protein